MKNFIIRTIFITLIIVCTCYLLRARVPQFYLRVFPWILLFFASSSLAVHAYQLNLSKKDFARFARSNMVITFLKLVIYSAFAIIYIAVDTQNAKIFVVAFFLMYLIFTVNEVLSLLKIKSTKVS